MKQRWKEGLLAFLLAFGIWYIVTGSEKVESQVEVRADYRGLPQGLVIRSGTVNRVSVRVRASVGMIHSLSGRDFACNVDLSSVTKGDNTLLISPGQVMLPGGVEVIDVVPSRIYLDVDTLESKTVPVRAEIQADSPGDYVFEAHASPAEVRISGAASQVGGISSLPLPLNVEKPFVPGVSEIRRLLPLPRGVDASPSGVQVTLHIGIRRKSVQVQRQVQVQAEGRLNLTVRPDRVRVSLAVPDSLAGKAASNEGIKAYAQLERFDPGSYTLPVRMILPDGAELVATEPASVVVTVEHKPAVRPSPGNVPSPGRVPAAAQSPKPQPGKRR